MELIDLVKNVAVGATVGCFICMLVVSLISLQNPKITFIGSEIINFFLGSVVIGWGFSISAVIYEKEELPLSFQVIFQMLIGMSILFLVAIYLKWMPVNLGVKPILTWVVISCVFAALCWLSFYIYYSIVARNLNKKIVNK